MKIGLNLNMSMNAGIRTAIAYNFANMSELPSGMTVSRSGGAWYNDVDGYIQYESASNTARLGRIYDTEMGLLVEKTESAENLYSRPSVGAVGDHLSAGSSIASIVTDADNPCKNLSSGTSVWELDNSGGGAPVDVEWAGAISSGKASAMAYIETVSGDAPTLSISGNGTQETGHTVAGYTLYRCEDRSVGGSENLRISVPAGSVVRVACVNLQAYDCLTSFIDTAGTAATRNGDDVNFDAAHYAGLTDVTILYDFTLVDDSGETTHLFEVRDSSTNERITFWQGSGVGQNHVKNSSGFIVNTTTAAYFNRQRSRIALSYTDGQIYKSLNGFTEIDDTSAGQIDFDAIAAQGANAGSFLSINRSGFAPANGVVHRYTVYNKAFSESATNSLTDPNTSNELWIAMFGDSNLYRWEGFFDGAPQAAFISALEGSYSGDINIVNKGDSSSAANYDTAQAQGVDYWSGNGDSGGGTSWLQAIGTDNGYSIVENTFYQKKKVDYVLVNIAAADIVGIADAVINKAEYKASMQNVLDITLAELGDQVKFVFQFPPNATNGNYTDAAMQDVRDAMRELVSENDSVIGSYDLYDVTLVDSVHPNEAGFNKAAARAANIILNDLGLAALTEPPKITGGTWGQNKVYLVCDSNLTGDDPASIRIEDDGAAVSISSVAIEDNIIELTLSSVIAEGSTVTYYVGYGMMNGIVEADVIRDTATGLPLQSTGELSNLVYDEEIPAPPIAGWDGSELTYNASGDIAVTGEDYPYGLSYFNNDNSLAVLATGLQTVQVWQLASAGSTVGATRDSDKDYNLGVNANDIRFKPDGSEMYTVEGGRYLRVYTISGNDPSTASNVAAREFDFLATNVQGFDISPDGTVVVACTSAASNNIRWFETPVAGDFSQLVEDTNKNMDIADALALYAVKFGDSGDVLSVMDKVQDKVRYFDLAAPYDTENMTEDVSKAKDISGQETDGNGVDWTMDGSKMVVVGWSSDTVKLYE
tara:strand:+ start:27922 stop:30888 length:2967 start_codon:yes stop_codon:yes gene_type:complete